MRYAALPANFPVQPLPFYLAMEEYLARAFDEDFFFMWQVQPTVIFGRNQRIDREVNLDYCKENNIRTVRRRSGGGCVYADMSNIMFSYITSSVDVETTFSAYTGKVAGMLRSLGLNAEATGRNDVLVDGCKVSGNAFYHIPGRSIVHGTMLYNTDFEAMSRAISPPQEKLASKGVNSVRSRVTNLSNYLSMDIESFKSYARTAMCGGDELLLTDAQIEEIRAIEQPYYDAEWIYGKRGKANMSLHRRWDGIGDFTVDLGVVAGKIEEINVSGDFFLVGDLDRGLLDMLRGVPYESEAIESALSGIDVSKVISKLSNKQFINLLL